MKKTVSILAMLLVVISAMAQTSLQGVVTSADGGQPIEDVKVTLAGQNISTTTNQKGEFTLTYLEAIEEEVIFEAEGYLTDIQLVVLEEGQSNDMGTISLKEDIQREMQDEILLTLSESALNDDEGKSQQRASGSSASIDVFNSTTSYAWSSARYRGRGYDQTAESYYINGVNFTSAERGTFNYSALGGLNDATRNREVVNGIEANNFTFGGLGQATNYMMEATRYAQGWKVGVAATNRNYKGRVTATYSSGLLDNGWAFTGQIAWRYSPMLDMKGIIGEGSDYNSFGYFFSAEKRWHHNKRLSIVTFGAPTQRGQNAAVTQECTYLTGTIYYNPYWGYQNGKPRNSREVKTFDPTVIVSYDWMIDEKQRLHVGVGMHYNTYSNSALTFYNAPDPRPDYYRNMPSFFWDGQLTTRGTFIMQDLNGKSVGYGSEYNGYPLGGTVNFENFKTMTDLWKSRDNATTQINWDALYSANYANNYTDPLGSARYMVERRHNDIGEYSGHALYTNNKVDHLKLTAGLELKGSMGVHYKTVDDLLGGNQWIDIDPFADRDIKELATNIGMTQTAIELVRQNNITNDLSSLNRPVAKGDIFGYFYTMNIASTKLWAQNEWTWNEVDLYYALQATITGYNRTSFMLNGRAWYQSFIDPKQAPYYIGPQYQHVLDSKYDPFYVGYTHVFVDPAFKIGATYKIDGHNTLRVNALAETAAPYARDAYISQRVHDRVVENIYIHDNATNLKEYFGSDEKRVSYDLTYEFNFPIVRGRITAFQSHFWNATELNGYYDDETRTFVNQALTGINKVHRGVEAAAAIKLGKYFTLTPVIAIGDFHYTSNAYSVTSAENGMAMTEDATRGNVYELRDSVMIKGLKVNNGPQLNTSLKLSFFHPDMWFADITVSYFDWNYIGYAPSRRMMGLYTGTRADGTSVNGWYGNVADGTTQNGSYDARNLDENGNIIYDKSNGYTGLVYPYNMLDRQESLVDRQWYNRFFVDLSVGKLIYLKNRQSLSINLSVTNVTNNTHFKTGGYQQARLPRQTIQGADENNNSRIATNVWKYPAKYYYAWGTNFYLTCTYKF
ncbi:MAG: carboxypeptidase regulatory-like domain-containing protein [Paludibacteraceae bacterium]|nr:carboxypeptidase regulatory-like domain-containing protein [Paludibacteraceae bacterium]